MKPSEILPGRYYQGRQLEHVLLVVRLLWKHQEVSYCDPLENGASVHYEDLGNFSSWAVREVRPVWEPVASDGVNRCTWCNDEIGGPECQSDISLEAMGRTRGELCPDCKAHETGLCCDCLAERAIARGDDQ